MKRLAIALAPLFLAGCLQGGDSDMPDSRRSGVLVRHDALTGCQYLEGSRGGLTPRLDATGKQVCKK